MINSEARFVLRNHQLDLWLASQKNFAGPLKFHLSCGFVTISRRVRHIVPYLVPACLYGSKCTALCSCICRRPLPIIERACRRWPFFERIPRSKASVKAYLSHSNFQNTPHGSGDSDRIHPSELSAWRATPPEGLCQACFFLFLNTVFFPIPTVGLHLFNFNRKHACFGRLACAPRCRDGAVSQSSPGPSRHPH